MTEPKSRYTPNPMPDIGISQAFLLKTLRNWLTGGVSESNLASSVRINEFQAYSGGMKAKTVGELSLDLKVTIKEGPEELIGHKAMMNYVNDKNEEEKAKSASLLQDRIFPEVMSVTQIPKESLGEAPHYLMLMQSLSGYYPLEDALYEQNTLTISELEHVIDVVLNMLEVIHNTHHGDLHLPSIAITPSPFKSRLTTYLEKYFQDDTDLSIMNAKPGYVNGEKCPPLRELLEDIQCQPTDAENLSLIHGDCHLGNIMLRRRGKNLSVRLIDPNPTVGYSLPVYDYGKLYHFADPVGWTRREKLYCAAKFTSRSNTWSLDYEVNQVPPDIEKKRVHLVGYLDEKMRVVRSSELSISRAAAHVALAQLNAKDPARGRYCLGEAISHLLAGVR